MSTNKSRAIIEVRQRKIGHGWASLYICYTPTLIDMNRMLTLDKEDLGIKVYTDPRNTVQESYNTNMIARAKTILDDRKSEFNQGRIRLAAEDFISFYSHLAATKTYNLTASLRQLIKFAGDRCAFKRISRDFIHNYQTFLECKAETSKGGFLANSTVTLYINQMMAICREAIKKGYLAEDVISEVSLSRLPHDSNLASLAELRKLYRCHERDFRVERLLSLQLLTGLPFSYLLKLKKENLSIDESGNSILIIQGKREKKTYVSNEAADIIRGITGNGYLFEGMSYRDVNLLFIQWITNAGLKKSYRLRNFRLQIDSLDKILSKTY